MAALPMFPLGTVLMPSATLPLHIFEPRYRKMMADCLAGERCFGVVLIERGSEVGGGDVRSSVGTRAQIVGAAEQPDGRWFVMTVGAQRIRVTNWLPDDPYPRAEVEDWPDPPDLQAATTEHYQAMVSRARRLLGLAAELGAAAGEATTEFAEDPALGTFQVAGCIPCGPFDRQRVLATEGSGARCELLVALIAEQTELFSDALGLSGEGDAGAAEA